MASVQVCPGGFVTDEMMFRLGWDSAWVSLFLEPDDVLDETRAAAKFIAAWRELLALVKVQGYDLQAMAAETRERFVASYDERGADAPSPDSFTVANDFMSVTWATDAKA